MSEVIARLYNLLDAMEHNTNNVRESLNTQDGRIKVVSQDFGIPYDPKDTKSVGYKLVHYEMDTNFNTLLEQLIQQAKETLTGKTYSVQPLGTRLDKANFEASNLFGFLYQLTQDSELYEQFRDPAKMDAVLAENLPTNAYKEREAIKSLMAQAQQANQTSADKAFDDSMNSILSTLESSFHLCC